MITLSYSKENVCQAKNRPLLRAAHNELGLSVFFRPSCKQWKCEVCGPINAWKWAQRARRGARALMEGGDKIDFVTVTMPGYLDAQETLKKVAVLVAQAKRQNETRGSKVPIHLRARTTPRRAFARPHDYNRFTGNKVVEG